MVMRNRVFQGPNIPRKRATRHPFTMVKLDHSVNCVVERFPRQILDVMLSRLSDLKCTRNTTNDINLTGSQVRKE